MQSWQICSVKILLSRNPKTWKLDAIWQNPVLPISWHSLNPHHYQYYSQPSFNGQRNQLLYLSPRQSLKPSAPDFEPCHHTWYRLIRIKLVHSSNLDSRICKSSVTWDRVLLKLQTTGNRTHIPVALPAKTTEVYNLHVNRNESNINIKTLHSSSSAQLANIFKLKLGVSFLIMSM